MNGHDVDPRLHAYLDGEMSASEARAFEGELRPGSTERNQLDSLLQLRAWFRATRPRAPSNLFRSVVNAIEQEHAIHPRANPGSAFSWSLPMRARLAWIGFPVAALILLIVLDPSRRDGERPTSPGAGIEAMDSAPPPAIQTSRSVASGGDGPNTVRYVFTVQAAHAREICLAGDFNYWKVCDTRLARVGEDVWSITVDLPRGRHEYMFVVDGRWVTDPTAMGYVEDGIGNRNALLVI